MIKTDIPKRCLFTFLAVLSLIGFVNATGYVDDRHSNVAMLTTTITPANYIIGQYNETYYFAEKIASHGTIVDLVKLNSNLTQLCENVGDEMNYNGSIAFESGTYVFSKPWTKRIDDASASRGFFIKGQGVSNTVLVGSSGIRSPAYILTFFAPVWTSTTIGIDGLSVEGTGYEKGAINITRCNIEIGNVIVQGNFAEDGTLFYWGGAAAPAISSSINDMTIYPSKMLRNYSHLAWLWGEGINVNNLALVATYPNWVNCFLQGDGTHIHIGKLLCYLGGGKHAKYVIRDLDTNMVIDSMYVQSDIPPATYPSIFYAQCGPETSIIVNQLWAATGFLREGKLFADKATQNVTMITGMLNNVSLVTTFTNVSDGTIKEHPFHEWRIQPLAAVAMGTVAGEIVTITAMNETHCTFAIKRSLGDSEIAGSTQNVTVWFRL